jgi:hypothetical protein
LASTLIIEHDGSAGMAVVVTDSVKKTSLLEVGANSTAKTLFVPTTPQTREIL